MMTKESALAAAALDAKRDERLNHVLGIVPIRLSILDVRPVSQSSLMNVIKRVRIADVEQTRIFAAHQSMFGRAARQTDEGLAAHRSRSSVLTLIDKIAPNPHIRLVAGVSVHRNAKVGGRSDKDLGCCFEVAFKDDDLRPFRHAL